MKTGKTVALVLGGLCAAAALVVGALASAGVLRALLPLPDGTTPAAIGIIGGADGPTAVFVTDKPGAGPIGWLLSLLLGLRALVLLGAGTILGLLQRKLGRR